MSSIRYVVMVGELQISPHPRRMLLHAKEDKARWDLKHPDKPATIVEVRRERQRVEALLVKWNQLYTIAAFTRDEGWTALAEKNRQALGWCLRKITCDELVQEVKRGQTVV